MLYATAYYCYVQYSCILFRVLGFLLQRDSSHLQKAVLPTGYKARKKKKKKNRELLEAAAEVEPLLNNHIISLAAAWSFEVYFLPGDSKGLLVPILKVNERNGRIISKIGKPHHIHGLLCGLQGFPFKKVFWDYLKKSYQQQLTAVKSSK